ncbi:MAG: hypothetical protein COW88_02685 [Candidatus Lloydbacteria bacterium CG22_combo_CG10-13_8_21_14_all_47_15]|uniref:SHS2 domain-containing protein n=1 Tax=Candidatus Lloydbacteria bacterium CG22_combo_CG10-13_8_21_14_all_47_15 TaxID=1974635 RepID=A0A2H0CTL7_9BACT|nr:MAG: hypothetical protein COW88_02685 [Candidatus Lloydbacteria bacterium CG22_combo_CG10-13_8_21_14_all_47_15]
MWLFSKKTSVKQRRIVLFDIGSLSVGGAIVQFERAGDGRFLPTIVWSKRVFLPFQKELNIDRLVKEIYRALSQVCDAMIKNGVGRPDTAHVVLASPWHMSQTRVASFSQKKPTIVSEWLVDTLVDREVRRFLESGSVSAGASSKDAVVVIEEKGMKLLLNGFAVDKPFGKRAKEVDVALYVSMSPGAFLGEITKRVDRAFTSIEIEFHTFSFVAFDVVRDMFAEEKNFLVCDVSGEVTDVSVVRDDVLIETASFPHGKNSIMRAVMKASGASPEEALSRIALSAFPGRSSSFKAPMKKALEKARHEWKEVLADALAKLSEGGLLPHAVFLTAGAEASSWFSDAFETTPAGGSTKPFSVTEVSPSFLRPFIGVSDAEKDAFLLLEALFTAKVEEKHDTVV